MANPLIFFLDGFQSDSHGIVVGVELFIVRHFHDGRTDG